MRRSIRRRIVLGLYWEKSWLVCVRSRRKIFFSAFSVTGVSPLAESLPKACVT